MLTIGNNHNYNIIRRQGSISERLNLQYPELIVVESLTDRLNIPVSVAPEDPCRRCRRDDHRTRNCPVKPLSHDWLKPEIRRQPGRVIRSRGFHQPGPEFQQRHQQDRPQPGFQQQRRHDRPQPYWNQGYFSPLTPILVGAVTE